MRIGVCSWSLQPESPEDLANKVLECGLSSVQLALDPLLNGDWDIGETVTTLRDHNISILSAMVQTKGEDYTTLDTIRDTGGLRPSEHWNSNMALAQAAAAMCADLGVDLVSFHAGFIPHNPEDTEYWTIRDRVLEFAHCFHTRKVRVALETGQESAETLLRFLDQLGSAAIGVNFDPANMILYGMGDPTSALALLHKHTFQIHLKDANSAYKPGTWGTETPVGQGEVDWADFFYAITRHKIRVDMCYEREAGKSRVKDVKDGVEFLQPLLVKAGADQ
ncbi:MAG: sugar phosphate isomerase/epimerase [Phycisphaerales bacterium]